jgi:F-type H+-transporting ATPase subunit epsilon
MHLEIITPEKKVFKGEVEAVQLPGLDGSFQVLKGHAPIISSLREGKVKINLTEAFERTEKTNAAIEDDARDTKVIHVQINGGLLEMQNDSIILLAE